MSAFWKILFKKLKTQLLYSIIYYSQTDEQTKQTNQTVEIILHYFFSHMKNLWCWLKMFFLIQWILNTALSTIIKVFSHKLIYDVNLSIILNLAFEFIQNDNNHFHFSAIKIDAQEAINYTIIKMKKYYDSHHQLKFFQSEDKVQLQLHKKYIIQLAKMLDKKYTQQYIKKFTVLKQIECLVYYLNLFFFWKIHSVISIIYLKSALKKDDLFNKQSHELSSMIIDNNHDSNDSVFFNEIE